MERQTACGGACLSKMEQRRETQAKVALTSAPIRVQVVAQPIVAWGPERLIESAHPRLYAAGSSERIED